MLKYDLIGKRFGRLVVIAQAEKKVYPCGAQMRQWKCRCDCGNETIVNTGALTSGNTKSCGCIQREKIGAQNRSHGKSKTRLYQVWKQMKKRCKNPNDRSYRWYGGLDVNVCEDWEGSFSKFEKWMLEHGYDDSAKRGMFTIDRIDPEHGYSPENCRVVDMKVQARNRRKCV